MAKKTKPKLSAAEKSDKGNEKNEEMRGKVVQTGVPLWQHDGRKRHLQFKAGKMYVIDNMVHPDPRKGYICIEQGADHVMHFCWMERDAIGTKEDDLTPEPYDSMFKRVIKCTTGRVYVLKIKSTNTNHFFWMQEPSTERDTEIVAKINFLLNYPPPWLRFPHIACNFKVAQSPSMASEYDSAESMLDELEELIDEEAMCEIESIPTSCGLEYVPTAVKTFKREVGDSSNLRESLRDFLLAYEANRAQTSADPFSPVLSPSLDLPGIIAPDSVEPVTENPDLKKRMEELLPVLENGTPNTSGNSVRGFVQGMQTLGGAFKREKLVQILMQNVDSCKNNELSAENNEVGSVNLERLVSKLTNVEKQPSAVEESPPTTENYLWTSHIAAPLAGDSQGGFRHETATSTSNSDTPAHDRSAVTAVLSGQEGSKGERNSTHIMPAVELDKWESITEPTFELHQNSLEVLRSPRDVESKNDFQIESSVSEEKSLIDGMENWQSATCSRVSFHDSTPMMNSEASSQGIILSPCCIGSEGSLWKSAIGIHSQSGVGTPGKTVELKKNLINIHWTDSEQDTSTVDEEIHPGSSISEGALWVSPVNSSTDSDVKNGMKTSAMVLNGNATQREEKSLERQEKLPTAKRSAESLEKGAACIAIKLSSGEIQDHGRVDTLVLHVDREKEGVFREHGELRDKTDVKDAKKETESVSITEGFGFPAGNETSSESAIDDTPAQPSLSRDSHEYEDIQDRKRSETEESLSPSKTGNSEADIRLNLLEQQNPESTHSLPATLKLILEQPGCSNLENLESQGLDSHSRDSVLTTLSSFITFSNSSRSIVADAQGAKREFHCHTESETERLKNGTADDSTGTADNGSQNDGSSSTKVAMMVLVRSVSRDNTIDDAKQPKNVASYNGDKSSKVDADRIGASSSGGTTADSHSLKTQNVVNNAPCEKDTSGGKKSVAQSKSLEDVIFVSGPQKSERYNLRKRPQQKVVPSLSDGPSVSSGVGRGRKDSLGKRPRMTSPGVPAPAPFKVPDASPVRSRHPQVSGSVSLLNSPNQEDSGNSQASRKRPNEEESDDESEAPPSKKVKTTVGSTSSIRKPTSGRTVDSAAVGKMLLSPGGSGSSPDGKLDKRSHSSFYNQNSSNGPSQSPDTSPRYNMRRRSAKIEDGQQTEPVKIREIRKAGPETIVRARAVVGPPGPPVNRANRDRSQNTRPVIIEDKNGTKSKSKDLAPSDTNRRPKP